MEKINNIEISNFKSIKHLKIDGCTKINVFVGKPNAGKSNILEAISVVGSFHSESNPMLKNFVRFNDSSELFFEENVEDAAFITIDETVVLDIKEEHGFLNITYTDNEGVFLKSQYHLPKADEKGNVFGKMVGNHSIKKYSFRTGDINDSNRSPLLYPFGENLAQTISTIPELRKRVNELFLENDLKLLIEKGTNELKIFKEYQDGTVFTLPYNMIADTLQRLIFYKAAIMSNKKAVLLFEEPEAHCFEPYILEFTNDVKYDENGNQFFIVTHSDFIIKEFLRDEESKENTNIYLVNNVDGETQVKLLEKDKNEDVYEYGMNVFFNFESLWETN